MKARLIAVICLSGLAFLFIIQNLQIVDVTFLFWTVTMSRALLILITLAVGFLIGWFVHSYAAFRSQAE